MEYDYDLVVIGGGAAGLTSAGLSASLGAKTALIEAKKLGGDCTWYGCVPSKSLLKAAKVIQNFKTAEKYGIKNQTSQFNFEDIINHVYKIQEHIYEEADEPKIYEEMGVDVIKARANFINKNKIELIFNNGDKKTITSRYFIIATGGLPNIPNIDGLDKINYLTNETLFSIKELPKKLIIIGAGPIGTEMAQAFVRFGSEVIVINRGNRILKNDDEELSDILKTELEKEGVKYYFNSSVNKFERKDGKNAIHIKNNSSSIEIEFDAVLLSAGRKPNINKLNLENAGVKANKRGIIIDNHCRTSVRNIFAVGDCAGPFQFTHYAEHMAKKAVSTALLHFPFSLEPENIVWCTYTGPELAHAGLTEKQLQEKKIKYEVYKFPFSKIDRAITESDSVGLIKVFGKSFSGKILGVSILGTNAGEMISEFALAIRNGITLRQISDTIHPYPTYTLGNRRAADQWYIRKQSQTIVKLLQTIFRYKGQLPDTSDPNRIV